MREMIGLTRLRGGALSPIRLFYGGVAELVYARDLKSLARERLGVRFPSPPPLVHNYLLF